MLKNLETDEIRDGYRWVSQACPVCGQAPDEFIGKRGGSAHREGFGVECAIWKCRGCEIVFPNPMPIPVAGLSQHYAVDADDYFRGHEKENKLEVALTLVKKAEALI